MTQRTALLVTTALTVFVMVMMVGVVWQLFQKSALDTLALQATANNQKAETAAVSQPAVAQPDVPDTSTQQATQAQIAEREAAYQQLIQQANARLDQAYKQQQDLSKQIAEQKSNAKARTEVASQQPKYNFTPAQAVAIALAAVPGAVLTKPAELVSFQDTASYEVTLDKGVVYVDANTGQVLYNSAAVVVVNQPRSGGGGNGGGNTAPPSTGSGQTREKDDDKDGKGGRD